MHRDDIPLADLAGDSAVESAQQGGADGVHGLRSDGSMAIPGGKVEKNL